MSRKRKKERKGQKEKYVFVEIVERGEVWRENPPIPYEELQDMYERGVLLTTRELAKYVGWTERYIYHLIKNRKLPYIRLGHTYYFSKEKIKEWQKERKGG